MTTPNPELLCNTRERAYQQERLADQGTSQSRTPFAGLKLGTARTTCIQARLLVVR